jgi:hypothetical protein
MRLPLDDLRVVARQVLEGLVANADALISNLRGDQVDRPLYAVVEYEHSGLGSRETMETS